MLKSSIKVVDPLFGVKFEDIASAIVTERKKEISQFIRPELILGDARDKLQTLSSNSVHIVITDPPYFLDGFDNEWNPEKMIRRAAKAGTIGSLPIGMKFDPLQGKRFEKFYKEIASELLRILRPGGFFLSFSQPRLTHRMAVAMEDAGFEIRDMYVWHHTNKSQPKAFSQNHFVDKSNKYTEKEKEQIKKKLGERKTPQLRPQFESIVLGQKPKDGTFVENWLKWETGLVDVKQSLNGKSPSSVMSVDKPTRELYNCHLTVKPVRLIEHLIKLFSKEGQIVLDPFIGSGTTALACINTNRRCIGIEINSSYVDIAEKRIKGVIL